MLLLGILSAQGEAPAGGAYDLLETQVLTSSASSVTFTGLDTLAAGYQHLQLRVTGRMNTTESTAAIRFNGDTGNNYARHWMSGDGGSVSSNSGTSENQLSTLFMARSSDTANLFGAAVVDILDFSSNSKNTTIRSLTGRTGVARIFLFSGLWNNTAAVTSIEVKGFSTDQFVTGSRFSLYGIKGA